VLLSNEQSHSIKVLSHPAHIQVPIYFSLNPHRILISHLSGLFSSLTRAETSSNLQRSAEYLIHTKLVFLTMPKKRRNIAKRFEDYFGSNNDLDNWKRLCDDVGVRNLESLTSITKCRKVCSSYNLTFLYLPSVNSLRLMHLRSFVPSGSIFTISLMPKQRESGQESSRANRHWRSTLFGRIRCFRKSWRKREDQQRHC